MQGHACAQRMQVAQSLLRPPISLARIQPAATAISTDEPGRARTYSRPLSTKWPYASLSFLLLSSSVPPMPENELASLSTAACAPEARRSTTGCAALAARSIDWCRSCALCGIDIEPPVAPPDMDELPCPIVLWLPDRPWPPLMLELLLPSELDEEPELPLCDEPNVDDPDRPEPDMPLCEEEPEAPLPDEPDRPLPEEPDVPLCEDEPDRPLPDEPDFPLCEEPDWPLWDEPDEALPETLEPELLPGRTSLPMLVPDSFWSRPLPAFGF